MNDNSENFEEVDGHDSNLLFEDEHEAFAARWLVAHAEVNICHFTLHVFHSRSSQYVFVPARDHFFPVLDQHADTLEGDVRLPLVILGSEGIRGPFLQTAIVNALYFREWKECPFGKLGDEKTNK